MILWIRSFQITNESHVYECLSSSPECDSNLDLHHGSTSSHSSGKRKSDGTVTESGGTEFKFHHQSFVRSISLPYCGSETESELYSPYGFYTGDEVSLTSALVEKKKTEEIP